MSDSAPSDSEKPCRMCGDDGDPQARVACPECGACFSCASDDCGICCDRLDYLTAEQVKHRAETNPPPVCWTCCGTRKVTWLEDDGRRFCSANCPDCYGNGVRTELQEPKR